MQKDSLMVLCTFMLAFALLGSFWFIADLDQPVLAPLLDGKYTPPHDHAHHIDEDHQDDHHHDDLVDVSDYPPTLALKLVKDSKSGYNLFLETQNFTFAPELSGSQHVPGMGHAHLYIDGKKIARLYGGAYHLDMDLGHATLLEVTLNANSHETLAIGDQEVEVTIHLEDYTSTQDNQHCHDFHCHKNH